MNNADSWNEINNDSHVNRLIKIVATDTFFLHVILGQEYICSQMFIGGTSDSWEVYPVKMEHRNGDSLYDFYFPCTQNETTVKLAFYFAATRITSHTYIS